MRLQIGKLGICQFVPVEKWRLRDSAENLGFLKLALQKCTDFHQSFKIYGSSSFDCEQFCSMYYEPRNANRVKKTSFLKKQLTTYMCTSNFLVLLE